MFNFKITKKKGNARAGILTTPHGEIKTPAFVPVATGGALKGASFEDISAVGADIFMVNTFHFYCKDEHLTVKKMGGLHSFLDINYPLMTDSGGFQVFSLGAGWESGMGKVMKGGEKQVSKKKKALAKVEEDRVVFRSPFDGRKLVMTPENSVETQQNLGADIIFAFDECTSPIADYEYQKKSLIKTHRWAERSLQALKNDKQRMLGIVQGGRFEDLRRESAKHIASLPFFGFAIGGSFGESFGDSKENMKDMLEVVNGVLPEEKPRHFLGIGEPEDIIAGVERGVDLFDCVIPTRLARHGTALTSAGRVNIKGASYREDKTPVDGSCECYVCSRFSRSYIHHLIKRKEIYGIMLLTHHNLFYILDLMKRLREDIES